MEQHVTSLRLDSNRLKELKLLGFEYLNHLTNNKSYKTIFEEDEFEHLTKVPSTKSALDMYQEYSMSTMYTFIRSFDSLVEDELVTGNIVELCGPAGSGKTQICFQLCVNVQLPRMLGGLQGQAFYICTNYNFSTQRVREIAFSLVEKATNINDGNFNLTVDRILSNITHVQIDKYEELIGTVIHLKRFLQNNKVSLVIVDCITFPAQQIETRSRNRVLYTLFSDLQRLSNTHGFVILITNNVTMRNKSTTEIEITPCLGETYYHRINSRIYLEKVSRNYYKATLLKSICNPEKSVYFNL